MLLFVSLGAILGLAAAQQSSQPDDPKTILLEARKQVMLTIDRLPRYMCTETIDRSTFLPREDVAGRSCDDLVSRKSKQDSTRVRKYTSDRLRLDVAVSGEGEIYSWAGENHFQDKSLADLVRGGATSTGAFGSFLRSIFEGNEATFTFNGQFREHGSALMEYGFRVPREKSQYSIGRDQFHATVAYDGTFLVDPNTFNLVRLNIRADQLPSELNICEDTTALEYSVIRLHSSEFLLPTEAHFHVINTDGSELENQTAFSGCHEFVGESSLSFSAPKNEQTEAPSPQADVMTLPTGLPFTITLMNAIDTAHSAAGDAIQATLRGPLRKGNGKVLLAKGARVGGRILKLERIYGPASDTLKVAIKLETVEVNGVPQPFHAKLESAVEKHSQMPRATDEGLRVRQELGTFGEMMDSSDSSAGVFEFQDVSQDYVIKRGMEINGTTMQ